MEDVKIGLPCWHEWKGNDFDGVMEQFDRKIGKEQIAVFHMNDSKNAPGSGKDRHENFGLGQIGLDIPLMKMLRNYGERR